MKKADEITFDFLKFLDHKRSSEIVVPNIYVNNFEFDIMRLTKNGLIFEYEIKISRADFKNDSKKRVKHLNYDFNKKNRQFNILEDNSFLKYDLYSNKKSISNRFFYVVPNDLISVDEVPPFAGLIYYYGRGLFVIKKNAPLMHKKKHFDQIDEMKSLAVKLSNRELTFRNKYNSVKKNDQKKKIKVLEDKLKVTEIEKRDLIKEIQSITRNKNHNVKKKN